MIEPRAHTLIRNSGRSARGFTLVEMVIVVAIMALVVGIAATSLSSLSHAALRKTSGIVAASMRASYDEAALTGKTYRLAFGIGDPKMNAPSTIKVEASKEVLVFDPETSTLTRAMQGRSDAIDWGEFATGAAGKDGEAQATNGLDGVSADLLDKVLGTAGKDGANSNRGDDKRSEADEQAKDTGFTEVARKVQVDESVRVLSVWTEGMEKPADSGDVYIYFFPNGQAQDAIVHLQDDDRRVISIRLSPLTGLPTITEGYVEAPLAKK